MPKKILIIDDDPVVVTYLTNLFEDNGYETASASNGAEGAEILDDVNPDLITLDLQMPEEWGPRFYRKLTKNKKHKDTPVIIISGLPSSKYSVIKAAGHMSKPFDADKLIALVEKVIGKANEE